MNKYMSELKNDLIDLLQIDKIKAKYFVHFLLELNNMKSFKTLNFLKNYKKVDHILNNIHKYQKIDYLEAIISVLILEIRSYFPAYNHYAQLFNNLDYGNRKSYSWSKFFNIYGLTFNKNPNNYLLFKKWLESDHETDPYGFNLSTLNKQNLMKLKSWTVRDEERYQDSFKKYL